MACPRGEKDSELITGRVGILSNEKGEVLKACCVWSAGLNPLYLEHGGGGGGAYLEEAGGWYAL